MSRMIGSEKDVFEMVSEASKSQIPLTKAVFESGEEWAMAVPYRYYLKTAVRLHLAFLPLFICFIYNPMWLCFTLPLYPIVVFLYARLIRHMRTFSVRGGRLWLVFWAGNAVTAALAYGIVRLLRVLLSGGSAFIRM